MLAYHAPDGSASVPGKVSPSFLPKRTFNDSLVKMYSIGTPEVAYLVSNVSSLYSQNLSSGTLQPAAQTTNRSTRMVSQPLNCLSVPVPSQTIYHNPGDISDHKGFDFNQPRSIAKVQLATLMHVAGNKIKPEDW